jgi:hypothetical protein
MSLFHDIDRDFDTDLATASVGAVANSLSAFGVDDDAVADAMIVRALAIAASRQDIDTTEFLKHWLTIRSGL